MKLHLGNSGVDLRKPEHLARVQAVFRAANEVRFPVVAHLWTGPGFGREEAEIFFKQVIPQAPDVVIQIAHMAGGGPGYTDEALEVFASAIEAGASQKRCWRRPLRGCGSLGFIGCSTERTWRRRIHPRRSSGSRFRRSWR